MTSLTAAWRALDDAQHRARFYRLWRTAASAGFTIVRSMEVMGPAETADVERCRRGLQEGITAGRSLTDLVRDPAAPFSPFETGLLSLADESGRLELVVGLLADYHDRRHRSMVVVRKRLAYPLFTAAFAIMIAPLPLLVSGHARAYVASVAGGLLLLGLAGGVVVTAAAARFGRAPRLVVARLARGLSIAIEAGLPLGASLTLAAEACDAPAVARHVAALGERRVATQPLHVSLASCPMVTPEFLAVLANAERTGDYTHTLARLADLHEETP